jgi:predicted transcriptional regulator
LRRGRHLDHEKLGAKVIGGQFAQLDKNRAGLRFMDDGELGASTDPIQGKDAPERGQPFAFDAFLQHALPFVLDGRA